MNLFECLMKYEPRATHYRHLYAAFLRGAVDAAEGGYYPPPSRDRASAYRAGAWAAVAGYIPITNPNGIHDLIITIENGKDEDLPVFTEGALQ